MPLNHKQLKMPSFFDLPNSGIKKIREIKQSNIAGGLHYQRNNAKKSNQNNVVRATFNHAAPQRIFLCYHKPRPRI
ncbi:MAG: hypothetical protein ACR2P4_10260, partial [Gammaproteobacteria bacterium]